VTRLTGNAHLTDPREWAAAKPSGIRGLVPILVWLPRYDRHFLRFDVVAGATIWGLLVPESIAYAGLAGVPPQAGLYTLLATLAAYAVFGTSRHLVAGATSAAAVLLASSVGSLASEDASRYAADAAGLVLFCGGLFLIAGLLRLGFVAQFLSRPVMAGFVFGLAIFVTVSQLPKLFGIKKGEGDTIAQFAHLLGHLGDTSGATLVISLGWDAFLSRFTGRAGCSLRDAALERRGQEFDVEQFLSRARASLQARAFELVVALDQIPDELAGTLTYLRSQGNRISGLEVQFGSARDLDVVAPRWIARSATPPAPPVHGEATLLHALSKRCSPETVAAVLALRDGLIARGARVSYGRGASPSVTFWLPLASAEQPLFTIFAYTGENTPSLEVAFAYLKDRQATAEQLDRIAQVVRSLPNGAAKLSGLEASLYGKRPGLSLEATVAAPGAVATLLSLVDELQAAK
jgi:hypothetical protein